MSGSQNYGIFNLKFANITELSSPLQTKPHGEISTFSMNRTTKLFFFHQKIHFQGNSKACPAEIIRK